MIAKALRALLLSDDACIALIDSRVYPDNPPQSATYPCVTTFKVFASRWNSLDGPNGVCVATMQLGCRSNVKVNTKALADAVRNLLDGFPLKRAEDPTVSGIYIRYVQLVDERDVYHKPMNADDLPVFETQLDFKCWHRETP